MFNRLLASKLPLLLLGSTALASGAIVPAQAGPCPSATYCGAGGSSISSPVVLPSGDTAISSSGPPADQFYEFSASNGDLGVAVTLTPGGSYGGNLNLYDSSQDLLATSVFGFPSSTGSVEATGLTTGDDYIFEVDFRSYYDGAQVGYTIAYTATLTFSAPPASVNTPEPATLVLLGTSLAGLGALRRRRKTTSTAGHRERDPPDVTRRWPEPPRHLSP